VRRGWGWDGGPVYPATSVVVGLRVAGSLVETGVVEPVVKKVDVIEKLNDSRFLLCSRGVRTCRYVVRAAERSTRPHGGAKISRGQTVGRIEVEVSVSVV